LSSDPLRIKRSVVPLRPGLASYEVDFGSGRNRWGDYSGLALDPADDRSFWAFNQYSVPGTFVVGEIGGWASSLVGFRLDESSPLPFSSTRISSLKSKSANVALSDKAVESVGIPTRSSLPTKHST